VHLVRRGHYRTRDKYGDPTIRSAIVANPELLAKFTALSYIQPELLRIAVLHCGIGIFAYFSCDCDLDPTIFVYELASYPVKCLRRPKMNFLHQGFWKLSYYTHNTCHTDR